MGSFRMRSLFYRPLRRGKARVDDHKAISGIIHVIKNRVVVGLMHQRVMGLTKHSTIALYAELAKVFADIFEAFSQVGGPQFEVMVGSLAVRVHRVTHGSKGALPQNSRSE